MNENDVQDREVREYVRNRMAADMPAEFTRDVMNDVQRTTQRRRGIAWPIFTGLATVAAAVAVVVIGLGLLNQDDGVGSGPRTSASASPDATASPAQDVPASAEATPSRSVEPGTETSPGQGEFGPIHSMAPEEAFENGQTCEVTNAIVNAEPTALTWRIGFPEGWSTNEESTDLRSACTLFGPEPFEGPDDQAVPDSVAIETNIPPGGDFGPGGSVVATAEYTVDGVAAVRYEIEPESGGFVAERTITWIVAIAGNIPAEGNDRPYLVLSTSSGDDAELAAWADALDRMVATLDIGE
jgi:hypothetical protein